MSKSKCNPHCIGFFNPTPFTFHNLVPALPPTAVETAERQKLLQPDQCIWPYAPLNRFPQFQTLDEVEEWVARAPKDDVAVLVATQEIMKYRDTRFFYLPSIRLSRFKEDRDFDRAVQIALRALRPIIWTYGVDPLTRHSLPPHAMDDRLPQLQTAFLDKMKRTADAIHAERLKEEERKRHLATLYTTTSPVNRSDEEHMCADMVQQAGCQGLRYDAQRHRFRVSWLENGTKRGCTFPIRSSTTPQEAFQKAMESWNGIYIKR